MHGDRTGDLVGVSVAMVRLRAEISAVGGAGFRAVLLQGESGVGKEIVAHALHRTSPRATAPYEIFDCPAVPDDHLESELFGTVRGAFPGAADKAGALERAHGGTIFLDEIAAMQHDHQAKILRVIEGKRFRRLGGSHPIAVEVAVIAAAHEDLGALAAVGRFRHDLYYRLVRDGVIRIPALRERAEDIPVLARHYLQQTQRTETPIERAALARLAAYDWPGNVRQLQSVLRVALRFGCGVVSLTAVDDALRMFTSAPAAAVTSGCAAIPPDALHDGCVAETASSSFHTITEATQRRTLLEAYRAAGGSKTGAGVLLGFHRSHGEAHMPDGPLTDARRNLALRKFRYWSQRLGVTDQMTRRAPDAAPPSR